MISRVCEEFACPPDVAQRQDARLTLRIMELRGYARAKQQVDSAEREDQITHPLADTVMAIENEIAAEVMARRRAEAAERAREETDFAGVGG